MFGWGWLPSPTDYRLSAAAAGVGLAAAGVSLTAAAGGYHAVATAGAEQEKENDDPADVATTEAVVIHRKYLHRE